MSVKTTITEDSRAILAGNGLLLGMVSFSAEMKRRRIAPAAGREEELLQQLEEKKRIVGPGLDRGGSTPANEQ